MTITPNLDQRPHPADALANLFERSRDLLCITDVEGRVRRANAAWARAMGCAQGALPSEPFAQLLPAEERGGVEAALRDAVATGEDRTVITSCRGGGQSLSVEWQVCADAALGLVYLLGRDVTAERERAVRLGRFETLVEQAALGMAVTDLEGRIIYANAAMRATYGYGEETVGMFVPQLVVPDQRDDPAARMAEFMAAGCVTNEATFLCRDGTARPVEVGAFLLRDERGEPEATAAVIRDLSEERAGQQQLLMFKTLVQNSPDPVSVHSVDGQLLFANRTFREQMGFTHLDQGPRLEELVDRRTAGYVREGMLPLLAAGGSWRGRLQVRRCDGSTFPSDSLAFAVIGEGGHIQAIAGVIRDVTEQERVEREQRLTKFSLDRSPDGIFWADPAGAIIYANDGASASLGYSREELMGMRLQDIDPAFPALDWDREVWGRLKQAGRLSFETRHRRKDGLVIPVDVFAYYIEFEGREYGCSFARDISERKRDEDERLALQNQIISAQQAALRELSTPLIPIAEGVVVMPLIGSLDSARAQQVIETLLEGVATSHAAVAILDITGVAVVDTQVANALLRAAQAVRLLGARVVLTGIKPEVAQTLVNLGADMSSIVTRSSLQSGIAYALQQR